MSSSCSKVIVASFVFALLGTGCLPALIKGDSKPAPIRLSLEAAKWLNPDDRGDSLPTSVVVLQLASRSKVENLELTELLREPKELLGDDLLGMEELIVEPGQTTERVINRAEETRHLVVAMLARRPAGNSWREIVDLPEPSTTTRISMFLEGYRIARR